MIRWDLDIQRSPRFRVVHVVVSIYKQKCSCLATRDS